MTAVLSQLPVSAPRAGSPRAAILVCLVALGTVLLHHASWDMTVDLDLYHQMAVVRAAMTQGHFYREDVFAYTPTVYPAAHHEWGNGAIAYALVRIFGAGSGGAAALVALKFLLLGACAPLAIRAARHHGGSWPLICCLTPVALAFWWTGLSTVRAGLYSLLFTCILVNLLRADRRGNRTWLLLWLPLHAIWLNIHPGFVVGMGLVAAHWVEGVIRQRAAQWHLIAAILAMGLLTLANPYGTLYPHAIWRAITIPHTFVEEWQPVWQYHSRALLITWAVSLLVVAYALLRSGWRGCEGALLVLLACVAAGLHVRHCYLYAVVWLCYLPGWLRFTPLGAAIERAWAAHPSPIMAASAVAVVVFGAQTIAAKPWALRIPTTHTGLRRSAEVYPVGATHYLRQIAFHGNVMTSYNDGSYVMWELWPSVKVAMDSRGDVAYSYEQMMEIQRFYDREPGWQRTLERYPTDVVLIPNVTMIAGSLPSSWRRVYQDDAYELFARPGLELPVVDRRGQPLVGHFP